MKKQLITIFVLLISLGTFAQEDVSGCKDSPLFERLPNMFIAECSSNHDQLSIPVSDSKSETKAGKKTMIQYEFRGQGGIKAPVFFQIIKNYESAMAKNNGNKIYYSREKRTATLQGNYNGKDVWVLLNDFSDKNPGNYQLIILETDLITK